MMRVRDGHVSDLGELFERHHRRLFNFFVRLTGNRPASEDLVQDAFFRILKYRHTYRDDGDFLTWVYRLARNAGNDWFRKQKRVPVPIADEEISEPVCDRRLPPAELESAQAQALLREALARLPRDKRELLTLSRFRGLKYEQIGNILGLHRGRRQGARPPGRQTVA